jgi:hypothetical protein
MPEFVYFARLTFGVGCGIIMVSRGEITVTANKPMAESALRSTQKKISKKIEKTP